MNVYVESNFVLELAFAQEQPEACEQILKLCEAQTLGNSSARFDPTALSMRLARLPRWLLYPPAAPRRPPNHRR